MDRNLKLHEIVAINENTNDSILIESMYPYRKLLLAYYESAFASEPILMVTSVSNAVQYARIVPSGEFREAVLDWIGNQNADEEDNEDFGEYETICFNSKPLKDW